MGPRLTALALPHQTVLVLLAWALGRHGFEVHALHDYFVALREQFFGKLAQFVCLPVSHLAVYALQLRVQCTPLVGVKFAVRHLLLNTRDVSYSVLLAQHQHIYSAVRFCHHKRVFAAHVNSRVYAGTYTVRNVFTNRYLQLKLSFPVRIIRHIHNFVRLRCVGQASFLEFEWSAALWEIHCITLGLFAKRNITIQWVNLLAILYVSAPLHLVAFLDGSVNPSLWYALVYGGYFVGVKHRQTGPARLYPRIEPHMTLRIHGVKVFCQPGRCL